MMRDEVARGGAVFFGKNLTIAILGMALTSILARALTPENFGVLSIATSFAFFIMVFFNLGLEQASIKIISELRAKGKHEKVSRLVKNIISMRIFFTALLSLSLYLLSDFISGLYPVPSLSGLLKLSSLLIFSGSNARLLWSSLIGFKMYSESSKAEIIDKSFSILLFLSFFALGYAEPAFAIVSFAVSSALAWLYTLRKLSRFIIRDKERSMYRETLLFSLPLFLSAVLMDLQWDFANIILGIFDIPSNVGLLSLSLKISGMLILINKSFYPTFLPMFSELVVRGRGVRDAYGRVLSYMLLFAVFSTAVLLFFANETVLLFGGREYLPSVRIVQFLCLLPLISVFSNVNYQLFVSRGKARTLLYLGLFRFLLLITLLLSLTPAFTMWGVSLALFLTSFLATLVSTAVMVREMKVGFSLSSTLRAIAPLILAVPAFFFPELILRLVLFAIFILAYSVISISDRDLSFFLSVRTGNRLLDTALRSVLNDIRKLRRVLLGNTVQDPVFKE